MRLAYLDQRIHLHRGEAQLLASAIEWMLLGHLEPGGARPTAAQVLGFGPLTRVRGRLLGRARQEQQHAGSPPRKPWQLTLRYDEVAALMGILEQAPPAGGAWGEIQRVSLNLARYVNFDGAAGH